MHASRNILVGAALLSLLCCAVPGRAAEPVGKAKARSSRDRENAELKDRIRALEEENRTLKSHASAAAPAADPPPLDVHAANPEREDLGFFNLGVQRDFLKAERGRIVEQIQQFIPPLYEPVLPFHGYTLPPGALRMKLGTSIFNNTHNFGTDDSYAFFFDKVSVRNLVVNYDLFYGFELPTMLGRDLVLNLNVPYKRTNIRGTGHPFSIDPIVMSMNGDAEGLGDISFNLKKKWLDQGNWRFNLASFMGLITPTGKHREEFNQEQSLTVGGQPMPAPPIDVFSARPGQRLLPNSAQPGTGAWGFRIGAAATRQFERSALHAGVISNIFANNSDGITPGNEINFGASYVVPPLKADWLSLDFSVFGRRKSDEEFPGKIMHPMRDPATGGPIMDANGMPIMFTTDRPNFKHGTVMFISPSVILVPIPQARIIASPAFRLLQPTQGPSPEFMFTTSIELTF